MITIYDFVCFAYYIYKDPSSFQYLGNALQDRKEIYKTDFNPKQKKNGFYEVIINDPLQSNTHNDFYASLFIKVANQQAVGAIIAIRGTVPKNVDNDITDITSWTLSALTSGGPVFLPKKYVLLTHLMCSEAIHFLTKTLHIPHFKCFVVGHSLGGALAALMPAYLRLPIRAVTFNAPGIKDVRKTYNTWHSIINFRAKYDFVSKIDQPIGPVIDIDIPNMEFFAKAAFELGKLHGPERINEIYLTAEAMSISASIQAQHSIKNLFLALQNSYYHGGLAHQSFNLLEQALVKTRRIAA